MDGLGHAVRIDPAALERLAGDDQWPCGPRPGGACAAVSPLTEICQRCSLKSAS